MPTFSTKISSSKETALTLTQGNHRMSHYKIYCDGSSLKGGVGAAAVLYKNNEVIQVSRYYLGTLEEHTVYEAELIGIILVIHVLFKLTARSPERPS